MQPHDYNKQIREGMLGGKDSDYPVWWRVLMVLAISLLASFFGMLTGVTLRAIWLLWS